MTGRATRAAPVELLRHLRRARDHIDGHYVRALELDQLARVAGVFGFASLGSFSARFTQVVGESPTAYRNRWAARGGPHVPGCYLFMRGALDPSGTTGPLAREADRAI
jgi:AraC-like DNA-binding protein